MTRAEYKVSLRMWNYFVSRVSGYELLMRVHAWGTLGKSLTRFQSIVAAQRYTQKKSSQSHARHFACIVKSNDYHSFL